MTDYVCDYCEDTGRVELNHYPFEKDEWTMRCPTCDGQSPVWRAARDAQRREDRIVFWGSAILTALILITIGWQFIQPLITPGGTP